MARGKNLRKAAHLAAVGQEARFTHEAEPVSLSTDLVEALNEAVATGEHQRSAKRALAEFPVTAFRKFLTMHVIKDFELVAAPGEDVAMRLKRYEATQEQINAEHAYGATAVKPLFTSHEAIELSMQGFTDLLEGWRRAHVSPGFTGSFCWRGFGGPADKYTPRAVILGSLYDAHKGASVMLHSGNRWKYVAERLPDELRNVSSVQILGDNMGARPNCKGGDCVAEALFVAARRFQLEQGRPLASSDEKGWVMFAGR